MYYIGMIATRNEFTKQLGNRSKFNAAVRNGKLIKISHGLYTDEEIVTNQLEAIFKRYPNSILTLDMAFFFYDLTDYIPRTYHIATSQKAHKISEKEVTQIYISDKYLNIGKTIVNSSWGVINVYDKERMLIELFRFENRLGSDFFKEIVKNYRAAIEKDEIDFLKVSKYCKMFKNGSGLFERIFDVMI